MRTWSVSGTAFALCTRSSSLSMRTSTSICLSLLLGACRGAAPPFREQLLEALGDGGRDEFVHVSAEGRNLLHAARGDERVERARHHVDGLDLGGEMAVQLVHLELPLEVGDHAQALDDRLRLPAAREIDDELAKDVDLDVRDVRERLAEEADALVDREGRALGGGLADDTDDDAGEDRRSAADHVDVTERDRVVRAGVDGGDQCSNSVRRAEP